MAATTVDLCMRNHFYTIGGHIRVQSEGGAIGLDLTGEVTRLYMLQWDEKFIKLLKILGIKCKLFRRYVDDMFVSLKAINPGWYFDVKDKVLKFSKFLDFLYGSLNWVSMLLLPLRFL